MVGVYRGTRWSNGWSYMGSYTLARLGFALTNSKPSSIIAQVIIVIYST